MLFGLFSIVFHTACVQKHLLDKVLKDKVEEKILVHGWVVLTWKTVNKNIEITNTLKQRRL